MKQNHALSVACLLLLQPVAARAAAEQTYLACPQGLFKCGEMVHPPTSGSVKVPAICNETEMQQLSGKVESLKGKMARGVPDMSAVATTLNSLSVMYKDYAPKKAYLKDTAKAISEGLLGSFMTPLRDDLNKASGCIWDPKWIVPNTGCRMVGVECFDRSTVEWKMRHLDPLIEELMLDINANRGMLAGGLPTYIQGPNGTNKCASMFSSPPAPCKTHMNNATATLLQAVDQVRQEVRP